MKEVSLVGGCHLPKTVYVEAFMVHECLNVYQKLTR